MKMGCSNPAGGHHSEQQLPFGGPKPCRAGVPSSQVFTQATKVLWNLPQKQHYTKWSVDPKQVRPTSESSTAAQPARAAALLVAGASAIFSASELGWEGCEGYCDLSLAAG